MVYTDYKEAAERHLEVCCNLEAILKKYKQKEESGTLSIKENTEKQQLLADLYYLAGYVIECSYCCAVLKSINWQQPAKNLRHHNNSYFVSYRHNASASFVLTVDTNHYKPHQLSASGFLDFFTIHNVITFIHPIPLISVALPVNRTCYNLFDKWNAEIRYKVDKPLKYDEVFDFLLLTFEVIEGFKLNSMI